AMDGDRVDTYRGVSATQASATASASGIGDVMVRGKYSVYQRGASGIAAAAELRLPTGAEDNLLGGGQTVVTPRAIISFEHGLIAAHGSVGYSFGGASEAVDFSGAFTVVATPRVTITAECLGRRVALANTLVDLGH